MLIEFDGNSGNLWDFSGPLASVHNLKMGPCFLISCMPCEVFLLLCMIH